MAASSIIFGKQNDLLIKNGEDVSMSVFTFTQSNGNAFDFTGFASVSFTIYRDQKKGASLATVTPTIPVPADGLVYLSYKYTDIDLPIGKYWFELSYIDGVGDDRVLLFGNVLIR